MGKRKSWLKNVSEDWLRENIHNFRQFEIFEYKQLSESFLREFRDELDWVGLCETQPVSKDFIREFAEYTEIDITIPIRSFDENFVNEVISLMGPLEKNYVIADLFCYKNMSDLFIDRYKEDANWNIISKQKDLTEDFMRKYKDRLIWKEIEKRNILIPKDLKEHIKDGKYYEIINL